MELYQLIGCFCVNLVRIITDSDTGSGLYAVRFSDDGPDEFTRLFRLWTEDMEFLYSFFREHEGRLKSGYYKGISIQDAVRATRYEAQELRNVFLDIARKGLVVEDTNLDTLFLPLDSRVYRMQELQKNKARGRVKKRWLRLYAIRFDRHCYVITGGAIKLTQDMSVPHLKEELEKLERTREFLIRHDLLCQSDCAYLEI